MNIQTASAVIALMAASATPAIAQQTGVGSGLVVVNIGNISPEIAKNINVDVSQIPVTVQAPVGVAAVVCGINANVLAQQRNTTAPPCDAKNSSTALDQIVLRQVKSQSAGG